ncbi:geranylgeranyl reductase family protein [Candidatus Micrarchaeota archaeon]|nr:geranylgeranyl reductase family protein [Candidatus Micrarchaeota archaeon]
MVKKDKQKTPEELSKDVTAFSNTDFDVIVLGGGPSGSSAATFLSMAKKNVLLLDRARFPRDKTCGDGISGKSVKILKELGVIDDIHKVEHLKMHGVTFSSPKGVVVEISAKKKDSNEPPGFVCAREVFDNVLFQNAKKHCNTIEGFFANDLIIENGQVVGVTGTYDGKPYSFRAKCVVGADGIGGITARKVGAINTYNDHLVSALRAYYDGVEGMSDKIELHFVNESLPGYFWIFPLPNKKANVGIGMIVSDMAKKKINLEKVMYEVIEKNNLFKPRFANAKKISDVKRWQLPVGSYRPKVYGNGYLLVGDAASLIDPFTGEGIGNGLVSGKIASSIILKAFEKNDFSEATLSEYQTALYDEVGNELDTSYKLQKLVKYKFLINMIIDKANRSQTIRDAISGALIDPENQKQFHNPWFYLKVLLA